MTLDQNKKSKFVKRTSVQFLAILLLFASQAVAFWYSFSDPINRLTDYHVYDVYVTAQSRGFDPYRVELSEIDSISQERWGISAEKLPLLLAPGDSNFVGLNYSPLLFVLFSPLARLSPIHGAIVWYIGSSLAVHCALVFLSIFRQDHLIDPLMFAITAGFFPVLQTLVGGQINGFVLLAVAIAIWGWRKDHPPITGLGICLALLLKPLPAIIMLGAWLCLAVSPKYAGWALAWAVGAIGITVPLMGADSWVKYVLMIVSFGTQSTSVSYPEAVSLWAFYNRQFSGDVAFVLGVFSTIGIVLLICVVFFRWRANQNILSPSLILIGFLLIGPVTWYHYLGLLLFPIAFMLRDCSLDPRNWNVTNSQRLALFSIVLVDLQAIAWRPLVTVPLLSSWATMALIILFGVFAWVPLTSSKECVSQ